VAHFTKDYLLGLQPLDTPYKVSDEVVLVNKHPVGVNGLCLRVTPGGAKTFALRARTLTGRQVWIKIGLLGDITLDQAREEAAKHRAALARGEDPAKQRREDRAAKTVNDLADRFLTDHVELECKPKTISEQKRYLTKFIRPALGRLPIKEVGPGLVADLLRGVRAKTPVQANRIRACLSKMFSLAEVWELRDPGTNPTAGQARAHEEKRERRMDEDELRALGDMLRRVAALPRGKFDEAGEVRGETPYALAAVRLPQLTGMRHDEVASLRWEWVDLEAKLIRIPPGEHKTGKKIGTRFVYLCSAAVAVLEALPRGLMPETRDEESPWVIVGDPGKHLVQVQDPWERIREATTEAAKKAFRKSGKKKGWIDITDVTIHDLRRTWAGVATDLGYPEMIIGALLGHKAGTVTQGYARAGNKMLAEAAEAIGSKVWELLNDCPSK